MLIKKEYNRTRAVEYAKRWAFDRNPLFSDFTCTGGDCTSFVSQCIYAGSCVMDKTPIFGWYYVNVNDRSPSWTGVKYFYDYITGSGDFPPNDTRKGPFGFETDKDGCEIGDVVQLVDSTGRYYHSLLINDIREGVIFVSAHSDDAYDRELDSYKSAVGARYIHIEGIYDEYLERNCYESLLGGISLD